MFLVRPPKETFVTINLRSVAILALLATTACKVTVVDGNETNQSSNAVLPVPESNNAQAMPASPVGDQARQQLQGLRFLVDISDRKLRLLQGDRMVAEHDVAVGSSEWPTPVGSWQIHQVDLNPEWNPPKDEEWAEDREQKAPGDPANPLGRARLVYRMPNTIHGTNDRASLGTATSHGSIRVANEVVLQLAETLLRAGGSWEGPQKFQQMANNRTREFEIPLRHPVPINVQE